MNLFYNLMMNQNLGFSFAEKKMKRILTMIFVITIGINCLAQHKSCVGIDAGSLIRRGAMNISAGYGFSDRWSISWKFETGTQLFNSGHDIEYKEHLEELSDNPETYYQAYGSSIHLQYWLDSIYAGVWLETGCRCTDRVRADCVIGAGYMIPVWKGLKAALSYHASLLESFREGKPSGTGLTIGIYWTITHGNI